jgi:hypothetical protein
MNKAVPEVLKFKTAQEVEDYLRNINS